MDGAVHGNDGTVDRQKRPTIEAKETYITYLFLERRD
jgi:hypothetical protein